MSGLAGIWNQDGEPVSRQVLAAMSWQLRHRGTDGESVLLLEQVGFACQGFRVTPESDLEQQPLRDTTGVVVLWDGRLDNRQDLIQLLGVSPDLPDPNIVLAAYGRFRGEVFSRLDGDFAVVVYDPNERTLLLARDVMGARTLYYVQSGNQFLVASEIKALLAHPNVPEGPNDTAVAEWLYRVPDYSDLTRTFFRGIHSVPAGHVVRAQGGACSLRRYWEFDVHRELRVADHREYVDAYREAFSRAVRKRLRSAYPVGITVSGGIDSSSVYCMAQELSKLRPVPPLVGVSIAGEDSAADEREYQAAIEAQHGVVLEKVPLSTSNMVSSNPCLSAWHGEGPYLRWQVWGTMSTRAVGHGCRVILTGFFGDSLLTNPQYILDILALGRVPSALRHALGYRDWWEKNQQVASLATYLKGYLVPERFRPHYHRIRRALGLERKAHVSWYSRRLVDSYEVLRQRATPMRLPSSRAHAKALCHYIYSRPLEVKFDMEAKLDGEFGHESAHPFRDRDLVSLVMSIPGEHVYRAGARGIHREAMVGILPEAIRTRRTKATFLQPVLRGAIHDLAWIRSRGKDLASLQNGYLIENPTLLRLLDDVNRDLPACKDAILPWYMNDLVGLESWLSAFFDARQRPAIR